MKRITISVIKTCMTMIIVNYDCIKIDSFLVDAVIHSTLRRKPYQNVQHCIKKQIVNKTCDSNWFEALFRHILNRFDKNVLNIIYTA